MYVSDAEYYRQQKGMRPQYQCGGNGKGANVSSATGVVLSTFSCLSLIDLIFRLRSRNYGAYILNERHGEFRIRAGTYGFHGTYLDDSGARCALNLMACKFKLTARWVTPKTIERSSEISDMKRSS